MELLIYSIVMSYQAHDGDGWQHWQDTKILSYHSTLEGALAEKERLIKEWVIELDKRIELNPHLSKETFDEERERRKKNIILITEGTNSVEADEYDKFAVHHVYLKD